LEVCNVKGIRDKRNFIHGFYDEGCRLVCLDDDLESIGRFVATGQPLREVKSLEEEVIEPGFRACEQHGARLWGLYAPANPFYMQDGVYVGLCPIIGTWYGVINRRHTCPTTLDDLNDYEQTIQFYLADGAVCRLDNIGVKTRYFVKRGGGMAESRKNPIALLEAVQYLNDIYPDLGQRIVKKGRPDFRFKNLGPRRR